MSEYFNDLRPDRTQGYRPPIRLYESAEDRLMDMGIDAQRPTTATAVTGMMNC